MQPIEHKDHLENVAAVDRRFQVCLATRLRHGRLERVK
jgi:hypothetical protein